MISSLTDLVYPSAAAPPPAATAAMPSMRVQRADSKLSCAEAEGTATVHRHSGIPQAPIESVLAAQSIEQEYSVFDGISHFASPNFDTFRLLHQRIRGNVSVQCTAIVIIWHKITTGPI